MMLGWALEIMIANFPTQAAPGAEGKSASVARSQSAWVQGAGGCRSSSGGSGGGRHGPCKCSWQRHGQRPAAVAAHASATPVLWNLKAWHKDLLPLACCVCGLTGARRFYTDDRDIQPSRCAYERSGKDRGGRGRWTRCLVTASRGGATVTDPLAFAVECHM